MTSNWLKKMTYVGVLAAGTFATGAWAQASGGITVGSPDSKAAQHPAGPQSSGEMNTQGTQDAQTPREERSQSWDRSSAVRNMGKSTNSDSSSMGRVTTPPAGRTVDTSTGTGGAGDAMDTTAATGSGTHAKHHKKHGKASKTETSSEGAGSAGGTAGGSAEPSPK